MNTIEEFKSLWAETIDMVTFEINRRISQKDHQYIDKINTFFKVRIVNGLWLSETFPNKYAKWLHNLSMEDSNKGIAIKAQLCMQSVIIEQPWIGNWVKPITGAGLTMGTVAILLKKPYIGIPIIAGSALSYYYIDKNNIIIKKVQNDVLLKLDLIKMEIINILQN